MKIVGHKWTFEMRESAKNKLEIEEKDENSINLGGTSVKNMRHASKKQTGNQHR